MRLLALLLGGVVLAVAAYVVIDRRPGDAYPASLEQLQTYDRFHDLAGRPVLISGMLGRDETGFSISDVVDGERWTVRFDLEHADMRECASAMLGRRFVIVSGRFVADAWLGDVIRVTDGTTGCGVMQGQRGE
jgi:hypothetical protein